MADTPFPLPTSLRQTDVLVGDGRTTYGPFGEVWGIFDDDDVAVKVWPAQVGFTVEKVALSEKYSAFNVTFARALTAADTFQVKGKRPHRRELAVTRGGAIDGLALELELSKQAVVLQEQRRDVDDVQERLDDFNDDVAATAANAASSDADRIAAEIAAGLAVGASGVYDIASVAALIANTTLSATVGPGLIYAPVGTIIRTRKENTSYEVVASGQSRTTAGGLLILVLPNSSGNLPLAGFGVTTNAHLTAAVVEADARNLCLDWGRFDFNISAALSFNLTKLNWKYDKVKLSYTGANTYAGLSVYLGVSAGMVHTALGNSFEVDGAYNLHLGMRFIQESGVAATLPDMFAEGFSAKRLERNLALASTAGIQFYGGWRNLAIVRPVVHEARRTTLTNNEGALGLWLSYSTTTPSAYPVNTLIVDPNIRNIYNTDASGTDDMDGIGIFAPPFLCSAHGYARATVMNSFSENVWGRNIKAQIGHLIINNPRWLNTTGPSAGKKFGYYVNQLGTMELRGFDGVDSGLTYQSTAAVAVIQGSAETQPAQNVVESGVLRCTGAAPPIMAIYPIVGGKNRAVLKNVSAKGASSREFAQLYVSGEAKEFLFIEDCSTENLTEAWLRVEASGGAAPYLAHASIKRVQHFNFIAGSELPLVKQTIAGNSAQTFLNAGENIGFKDSYRYLSTDAEIGGFSEMSGQTGKLLGANTKQVKMMVRLWQVELAAGANITLPVHGAATGYNAFIRVARNDIDAYCHIGVSDGGFRSIDVGASFVLGGTADPGAGVFRLWRSAGTSTLILSNNDSGTRQFLIEFRG